MGKIFLVKENLKIYFPALIALIGDRDVDWQRVEEVFDKAYDKRLQTLAKKGNETMQVEVSLYDIIVAIKKDDEASHSYLRMMKFFDLIMWDLNNLLSDKEKDLLIDSIKKVLKTSDRRYREFLAEMMILKSCLSSGKYYLDTVEYKIPNGKDIDFRLKDRQSGEYVLIEVVSITLKDNEMAAGNEEIVELLNAKLVTKVEDKTVNLEQKMEFTLVPVMWGSSKLLKIYSDYFRCNKMHIAGVHEPFAYSSFVRGASEDAAYYRFAKISKLFDIPNEQVTFNW